MTRWQTFKDGILVDVSPEKESELNERFNGYEREIVSQYLSGMTIDQISRNWLEPHEDIIWHLENQGVKIEDKS